MIKIDTARTGDPVLKKDERWLGSSIDPRREASAWVDRAIASASRECETWIILGLGSGYHVAELKRQMRERRPSPKMMVIENDRDIVRETLLIQPELQASDIILGDDVLKLIERVDFRDAICGTYRILPYGPSMHVENEFFRRVEALLLGRDKLSFLLLLKTRPELLGILNASAVSEIANDEPISIKTLQKLFAPQSASSRERRLWRCLEELVV